MGIVYGSSLGTPNKNTATSATTITLTTNVTVPAGGHLVITVSWYNAGVTASVADNGAGGSLTWTKDVQKDGTADTSRHVALFSAPAPGGLASGTVITATFSSAAFGRGILGDYWTGVRASSPVDTTSTNQGTAAGWDGGNATTTNADDLVVNGAFLDFNTTTNTPTSPAIEIEDTNIVTDPATWAMEYRIVSATGTYSLAGTWASVAGGGEWIAGQVAYKAAASDAEPAMAMLPSLWPVMRGGPIVVEPPITPSLPARHPLVIHGPLRR